MNLDGNQMTEQDWEEVDRTSRGRAAALLKGYYERKGWDVEIQFTKDKICYDLLATLRKPDGTVKRIAVECKDRDLYVK